MGLILVIGWVVSTLLAGATIGSFTGGSLADKFGRTKTFILDAIPLAVGAFLWFVPFTFVTILSSFNMLIVQAIKSPSFQYNCPECANNDCGTLTCWHWDWHLVCNCAPLHI